MLVNAAQQRLFMYDDGKPVDSMVVVVGKTKYPTPMLAAYIRYAALNPYWYVPPDLAGEDVGAVRDEAAASTISTSMGYELVSDWTPDADRSSTQEDRLGCGARRQGRSAAPPKAGTATISWAGSSSCSPTSSGFTSTTIRGASCSLKSTRYFSGGCVRLEDAWRLSHWLFGRDLTWEGAGTEEPVPLAQPVPVYITYMTAMPDGQAIAYYDDAYGRDKAQLAKTQTSGSASVASASR